MKNYLDIVIVFIIILFSSTLFSQGSVKIAKIPSWVNQDNISLEAYENYKSDFLYLLFDKQDNLLEKTWYRKFVISINNISTLEEFSTIEFEYNPQYQNLEIYDLNVLRDGKLISHLDLQKFKYAKKESQSNNYLYDGMETAYIHLEDIQVGDILIYSYAQRGSPDVVNDKYNSEFLFQFPIDIAFLNYDIIAKQNTHFNFEYFNTDQVFEKTTDTGKDIYSFKKSESKAHFIEENVPDWVKVLPGARVSNWENWSEVVNWSLALYEAKTLDNSIHQTVRKFTQDRDSMDAIRNLIRFVQDDIRYLGIEEGDFALRPHSPIETIGKKFGDCKDKTLLLKSLLESYGIKSFPILVHTINGKYLERCIPGIEVFDHVILLINFQGKELVVDPTITYQGGDIWNLETPQYEYGLLIKEGQSGIKKLENTRHSNIKVIDEYRVNSSIVKFDVISEYFGLEADGMRTYFNSKSESEIENDYLNYYRNIYPSIKLNSKIIYQDYRDEEISRFYVDERYIIEDYFQDASEDGKVFIAPIGIENYVSFPTIEKNRNQPVFINGPSRYEHTIFYNYDNNIYYKPENVSLNSSVLSYESSININNSRIRLDHKIDLKKGYVDVDELEDFATVAKKINSDLSFYYETDSSQNVLAGFRLNYINLFFTLLILIIFIGLAGFVHFKYDPDNFVEKSSEISGGTLILFYILLISLVLYIFEFIMKISIYFNLDTIDNPINLNLQEKPLLFLINLFSMCGLLVLLVLVFIQFLQRRTSLPKLFIALYIGFIFYSAFNLFVFNGQNSIISMYLIINLIITTIIAIVCSIYILKSSKVKETFSKQRVTIKHKFIG